MAFHDNHNICNVCNFSDDIVKTGLYNQSQDWT